MSQKAQKTFVITNNHPNGQAAVNALELKHMLSGVRPKAPSELMSAYPELATFQQP